MKHSKVWRHIAQVAYIVALTVLSFFSLTAAIIAICASILVALYDKAGSLIELSFGPLKAKLERNVSEAEKLVMQLREFAVHQAKSLVSASVQTGRWASASDWVFVNAKNAEAALIDLGVKAEAARAILDDLIRYTVSDLGFAAIGPECPLSANIEGFGDYHAIRNKGLDKTPDEIEAYLLKWNLMTPEAQQRIADMRWIIQNGDIQDRDQYLRSQGLA